MLRRQKNFQTATISVRIAVVRFLLTMAHQMSVSIKISTLISTIHSSLRKVITKEVIMKTFTAKTKKNTNSLCVLFFVTS